jgi:hypothetical protein
MGDMNRFYYGVFVVLFWFQSGCATIVSGRTQDVMIRSNPPGATVKIDEIVTGTTPMVANLLRKKRHSIHMAKTGYVDVSYATTRGFNWWYIGNLVFGGIIGLLVDPISGSIFSVEPEEINASLPPLEEEKTPDSESSASSAT